jgi:hypothetical protein
MIPKVPVTAEEERERRSRAVSAGSRRCCVTDKPGAERIFPDVEP